MSVTHPSSLLHPTQLRPLILFAVITPLCIWWLDIVLLSRISSELSWGLSGVIHSWYVAQVCLLGWAVGRYISTPIIRWSVYVWLLVIIDLAVLITKQSSVFSNFSPSEPLGFAIASGEVSLLVVWAVLGSWRFYWRLPMLLVGVFALVIYAQHLDPLSFSNSSGWSPVLAGQTFSALILCCSFRIAGFKIKQVENRNSTTRTAQQTTQFSIFHLLVWITALAPIFAVAKFVSFSQFELLGSIWEPIALGTCMAIVSLLAIWCGLGRESLVTRLIVTLFATVAIGGCLAWSSSQHWFDSLILNRWLQRENLYFKFWITWTTLAACFLAGMLMIFRSSGHRLVLAHRKDSK